MPLVLGLEVVDVSAVAMDFLADRMTGPVDEPVAVAGLHDDRAADVVYFAAAGKPPGCHFLLHIVDRGITRACHNPEDLRLTLGHLLSDKTGPGDVAVYAAGGYQFCPEIDEHQIPSIDFAGLFLRGRIMRISSVCIDGHDRRGIGVHAPRGDLAEDELLQAVFAKIVIIV